MRSSYNEASRLPGSSPIPSRERRVSQSLDFSRLEVSIALEHLPIACNI